ncbi:GNAT family N-acetyltransferase [Bacillus sp. AG4(2022)]|uniref:GNAT family N-acetyltransferase n=1 Tax=Bacillus TaxID=1386 RepID=UPI0028829546|nr:GNAT family protein [Bacillus sp. AG4(2022)]MDT0160978.1 GNAT family protein [Bacillus sp. AG4(2022)]
MEKTALIKTVSLEFYKNEDESRLKGYQLPEEQLGFTSMPVPAIEACLQEDDRHPIIIQYGEDIAGFFVLHGKGGAIKYSPNEQAMLLRAYSISASYQGKGIAGESLRLLPDFVKKHFPDKNEIVLGVNHSNHAAQHVYKKAGFIDQGLRITGKKGEQYVLHMQL